MRRLARIVRAKLSLTFARVLGTVASAVAIALLASRLSSLFDSLAVVAITSVLSLMIAEAVRVTLEITGEKARGVLPALPVAPPPGSEPQSDTATPPAAPRIRVNFWRRWYVRYGALLLVTGLFTTVANWYFDQSDPAPVTVIQNPTQRVGLSDLERQELLDEAESSLSTVQDEVTSLRDELTGLDATEADVKSLEGRLEQAETALSDAQARFNELTALLDTIDGRLAELDGRLDELEGTSEQVPTPTPSETAGTEATIPAVTQ